MIQYMKKVTLISLIAPIVIVILRVIDITKKINLLGLNGRYQCAFSVDKPCSLFDYIFKGDDAIFTYIALATYFLLLFIAVSYIFLLIKLYKDNRRKLFWVVIAVSSMVLIATCFIFNHILFI